MSWDVCIFNAPASTRSVDQMPHDFDPPPLGAAPDIRHRLRANVQGLDLSDPAWGHLVDPTWSIELNLGSDEHIDSIIMLHVRGGGDDVLRVIAQIAASVGGRALDVSTGEFLTGNSTDNAGWHSFQQYRNQTFHDR